MDPGEEVGPSSALAVPGTAALAPELSDHPVQVGIVRQEEYSRWLPLVKWILLIPHYFVLFFLALGALFVWLASVFAVLFTGSYPRWMWNYMTGLQRWTLRVSAYHYLMTDTYPPFSLSDDAAYPARIVYEYPERVERWRPLVAWLLILPYAIVTAALIQVAVVMAIIAFFAILFTRSYPVWAFEMVEVAFRWNARSYAYAYFLGTRYPPYAWG